MKYLIGFFIIYFSISAFSKQSGLDFKGWEKTGQWGIYNLKPDNHFSPLKINNYRDNYLSSFSYLIKLFHKENVENKFCIIGYKWDKTKEHEGIERTIVFWKTANQLISWDLPDGEHYEKYRTIVLSKPFIDISESVVPYKEAEGAQALWAKEGVIQLIEDCELHGQKITIKPSEVIKFK
ncbi:hypothetical protein FE394_09190 [Xenorhabdus sp. Reich]|uniref:Uncharacterized protein n=1 Tax=Xenorhabdus littoralis TaxID=2582835 RepID=A0ABU4SL42_9GAMM|nr:hypothetical protein [Xenorhabdus sp. Reich]MDX7999373.1 hypothetical protein [Xenorhabdus sp. Reich]